MTKTQARRAIDALNTLKELLASAPETNIFHARNWQAAIDVAIEALSVIAWPPKLPAGKYGGKYLNPPM